MLFKGDRDCKAGRELALGWVLVVCRQLEAQAPEIPFLCPWDMTLWEELSMRTSLELDTLQDHTVACAGLRGFQGHLWLLAHPPCGPTTFLPSPNPQSAVGHTWGLDPFSSTVGDSVGHGLRHR